MLSVWFPFFITIKRQQASSLKSQAPPPFVEELHSLIHGESLQTVIISTTMLNSTQVMTGLPVRSNTGTPIRYSMNLGAQPWKRYNRTPIQYAVLTPNEAHEAGHDRAINAGGYGVVDLGTSQQ